jgi:hypothetical protein
MTLAVVGYELVTPSATTAERHVFLLRAGGSPPAVSPFVLAASGDRLDVRFCRWLGAEASVEERVTRMAARAVAAVRGATASIADEEMALFLCHPRARAGLTEATAKALERSLGRFRAIHRGFDDAGPFAALKAAHAVLESGVRAVLLVAADSQVSLEALDERVRLAPSEWDLRAPPPSEGAACVALMNAQEARRARLPVVATVHGSATVAGHANDADSEPTDGHAMSLALRELPQVVPAHTAFGPFGVDLLRRDDWQLASARAVHRFAPGCVFQCIESRVGRLGAVSGLANLVWGLATHQHLAAASVDASKVPFYAWSISPDGTRGVAALTAAQPS